ncbi:MAG: putative phenylacetic acid degradation-related protein [Candidatus Binatia bacterium]|nr:MAG: putative phenylacetic acid degradation-related protein [Candidatus Binatia bacterium]
MGTAVKFEQYDPRIAEMMIRANAAATGLPQFLGVQFLEFQPGYLRAEMPVRPELITPMGSLHGGVMAALIDHVLGCVLYPLMKPGQWAATTEFKLNYLAAVRGGRLVAESRVLAMTRRTAVVQVEVKNDETLAALAQGTLLIVDPPAQGDKPSKEG